MGRRSRQYSSGRKAGCPPGRWILAVSRFRTVPPRPPFAGSTCAGQKESPSAMVSRPGQGGCGRPGLPCLFLPLLLQAHGHQAPGHIFHPLRIGNLGFDLAHDFPHVGTQRIIFLHLIGVVPIGSGRVVPQVGKEGFPQQFPAGLTLALVE